MKNRILLIVIILVVGFLGIRLLLSPTDHPESYEIEGFNYVQQPDGITCGPTSTLMVLRRYGKNLNLDEVEKRTKTQWFSYQGKPIGTTSPDYISIALNHFGIKAHMKHLNLDGLKHYVSQRKPVIVLLRSSVTTWHYVAVIGFDKDTLIIADPGSGSRGVISNNNFMGAWQFTTDMGGNPTSLPCKVCNGSGKWLSMNLGPLSICEWCDGTGQRIDYVADLLVVADVNPMTAIVPSESLK